MSTLEQKVQHSIAVLAQLNQGEYAPTVFATSFGVEDMVLLDLISKHKPDIGVFTLDTGRLPEETYALMQQAHERYPNAPARAYFPQASAVEQYINTNGVNAFYQSMDLRKACCYMRKVEPLKRALSGNKAWITGLRREQAVTRQDLPEFEWDDGNQMHKVNPLADWSVDDVWAYVRANEVPYNALHDRNYPSIGCAPCTRAIAVGEDIRAGRWWWENPEAKECGLHVKSG